MSEEKTIEQKTEEAPKVDSSKMEDGKLCAILSYLVVGIIWYFADETIKKNEFAKFHVKQSLTLLVISIVGSLILGMIPILGWIILPFFSLATMVVAIIGIVNAVNGDKKELIIVGSYADKIFKF